jgi:esterase/lipase
MRSHGIWFAILGFMVGLASACAAAAQSKIGVVLVHGKQGSEHSLQGLADALNAAGYAVDRPEMCWSRRRIYDLPYVDCLHDIDAAVVRLRAAGASSIVIAGMSLGGNAALGYGARRDSLLGIIAMAPAPAMEFISRRQDIGESVSKARQMIAQGLGDLQAVFKDINSGETFDVTTTPNIYVTFLSPESPGVMPDNAAKLKVPLLVVSGQFDSTQRSVGYVFARAPTHLLNWHVMLHTNHRGTPAAARSTLLAWLKLLDSAPRN